MYSGLQQMFAIDLEILTKKKAWGIFSLSILYTPGYDLGELQRVSTDMEYATQQSRSRRSRNDIITTRCLQSMFIITFTITFLAYVSPVSPPCTV